MSFTTSINLYTRLFKNLTPYKFVFILTILGVLITGASEAAIYKFIAPTLFDKGLIEKNMAFLKMAPFYVLMIFIARGIGHFLAKYFMAYIGRSTVRDQRVKMLSHMLYIPVAFFDKHTTGELISKINYDAEQVAMALSDAVLELFKGSVTVIFILAVMFSISWKITSIVLIVAPIMVVYFQAISKRIRRYSLKVQNTMGDMTHVVGEVIKAHKIIRIFQGASLELDRIHKVTDDNRKQEIKAALVVACGEPVMQFIAAIAIAMLIYLVTLKSLAITPGNVVGLFTAMFGLIRPIKYITQVNNVLQKGIAAAQSIYKLLDEPLEKDQGTKFLKRAKGEIHIEKVKFAYNEKTVLNDISLNIAPGETVALVGRSGGGKTTLVSLLPRFYELQDGKILLDGIDIRDINLKNLREQIAIVTQQVVLFNDTVANNIAYGAKRNTAREEIIKAAEAAYAMEFIARLPQGLDTIIGQDGALLSGGQRQRLAIARAILKDAPILILDEATSSLDTESERYIQKALDNVMSKRTTIIIAHRLSTIKKADKILVLEDGNIIEHGTHIELMQKKSRYMQLQKIQDIVKV